MQPLLKKQIGEFKYVVYLDEDDYYVSFASDQAIEFASEKEKEKYMRKFHTGELTSFIVEKMKVCSCCYIWSVCDQLCGIHAETPDDALNYYLN